MMKQAGLKFKIDYHVLFSSILSGILLVLSFPKFGAGFVAWIALIPLIYAIKESRRLSEGFVLGFISGIICHIGVLYWITYAVVHYGNLPYYAGISAMMLLALYLSLYIAIFASGCVYFRNKRIPLVFAAPALWTCLEYAKSHLFTGFPWENLAHSQYLYSPLIQIADITGIYGITFMIVMVNIMIYNLLTTKPVNKMIMREVIVGCFIILITCTYGFVKISHIENSMKQADSIDVAVIQGSIDQNIKWNPQFQKETIDIYKNLSLMKALSGASLIIWPETATPFFFQDADNLHREVVDVAKSSKSWLLFGSPSYVKNGDALSFLNSAFLLSPDGRIMGQYDKVHLVPYGEYVPLRRIFPFISKLAVGVGDFASGTGFFPIYMGHHRLGVLICYEGIFPEAGRSYKNAGADLLVNITNDAWYGPTSAPYQHLSMTIFRAVENRLYVVRAANTGISAVIDPTGKIVSRTKLFEKTFLRETVKFTNDKTLYMLYGDVFVYICLLSMIVCILICMRRKGYA
jgi:apolipoprotein N-acyltransferase